MRLSIVTPVLTRVPGSHARWEEGAGMAELVEIARAADRLGYHHLTCSEHVGVPTEVAKVRGATYWDPLATFGYLAAVTERVRLATYVLVLGYHHPLEIAKRYGTLDLVSGGRLILGVGVGSLREEFELLDAPFADRGPRADDALVALRASLSREQPAYHGRHYDYGGFVVRPCAVQPRIPLWVGGRTRRSLRRAVELADGWAPFGVSVAQVADWMAGVEPPDGFEVVISPERALDPSDAPSACTDALGALAAAGTTIVAARVVHHSLAHYLEQLEALVGLAATRQEAV
jgi:probable F420-dependent oxidoreductase